jgi:hypothetical protein
MCSRVWGFCCKWSPNSSANLVHFSQHTVVRDWKTWILCRCMHRSVQSMRHAVEGDTSFSEAVAQTSVLEMRPHSHEWSQQCRACEHVACSHLFSCLPYSQLRETAPPTSSPYSLLVLPCTCTGFWTGAGLDSRICLQKPFHNSSFLLCQLQSHFEWCHRGKCC